MTWRQIVEVFCGAVFYAILFIAPIAIVLWFIGSIK